MKEVRPVLLGLLYGVYQEHTVRYSDGCSDLEYKLVSVHLTRKSAQKHI